MYGSNLKRAQSADAIKSRTSDVSPAVCKWTLKTSDGTIWPKWSGRHAPYLWRRTGWLGAVMAPSLSGQSCTWKRPSLLATELKWIYFRCCTSRGRCVETWQNGRCSSGCWTPCHQHSTWSDASGSRSWVIFPPANRGRGHWGRLYGWGRRCLYATPFNRDVQRLLQCLRPNLAASVLGLPDHHGVFSFTLLHHLHLAQLVKAARRRAVEGSVWSQLRLR